MHSMVSPAPTMKFRITGWVKAARPPFHSVGVMPLIVGSVLALKTTGIFNWPVFILSVIAVVLVMLSTYLNGEYHDIIEDEISGKMGKSAFAGGSQSMFDGSVRRESVRIAGYAAIVLAMLIGILLQFYFKTGPYTILLGSLGVFMGFFYSKPPLRLVNSGIGELMIGFCYGWLPVAVGFYIQTGYIASSIHWISIPIACTIFNVILINEFPDNAGDTAANKRNLTVRFGKERARFIYILATIISWIFFYISTAPRAGWYPVYYYVPIFLIGVLITLMLIRKCYEDKKKQEIICGLTIVTNLGTNLVYILLILDGILGGRVY
jgi:1,4-dihydroxy-2-naphthoate polyprenyltransferase